jgi:GTP-binding protein HflX
MQGRLSILGLKPLVQMDVEKEKAILVGVRFPAQPMWSVEDAMEELGQLALTAGAEVLYPVVQQRERPHPAYYIGRGKAVEIGRLCSGKASLVIFNANLSAAQIRNLEEVIPAKVIDRTELILDIFAQRARSREGKLQVELAQLRYLLPKLVGHGVTMSRLGGGIGSRGPGEMRLEVDRRRIRGRIRRIEDELEKVKSARSLHRRERQSIPFPMVALVGYTNSGKSTLLNRLTHAGVLAEGKLFATLDPTIRRLPLPHKREVLLVDTVGFMRDLPHMLIAAFMATLEETVQADLLLHVIDVSHPAMASQIDAVLKVLKELNVLEKNRIEVYNKVDCIGGREYGKRLLGEGKNDFKEDGKRVLISALNGEGLPELLEEIERQLFPGAVRVSLLFPFNRGDLLARVYSEAKVLKRQNTAQGVKCLVEIHPAALDGLKDFVFKGK